MTLSSICDLDFQNMFEVMRDKLNRHEEIGCFITDSQFKLILRVFVDNILPEELVPPCGEREPWPSSYQLMSDAKWEQRQCMRKCLLSKLQREN